MLDTPSTSERLKEPQVGGMSRLRGFGPAGLLAMVVIPFSGTAAIGAILVLVWARLTLTPWRELGFVAPRSWARALAVGVSLGVAFKFVMKALVMPLFSADSVNHAYHYL